MQFSGLHGARRSPRRLTFAGAVGIGSVCVSCVRRGPDERSGEGFRVMQHRGDAGRNRATISKSA